MPTPEPPQSVNSGESLLTALVSGSTAAAVAATLTYPLDSLKTQQQLSNFTVLNKFKLEGVISSSIAQAYKGGSALVIGSIFKNSARLILYNWLSKFMAIDTHDATGEHKQKTSAPRMVIAGAMSGFIETLWIVPFENIKITMIQNMLLTKEIQKYSDKFDVTGSQVVAKHHKPIQNIFNKQYVSPHAYFTSEILSQYKCGKTPTKFSATGRVSHTHHHSSKDTVKLKYNKFPSSTFFGAIKEIYTLKGLNGFTAGTCVTIIRQMTISFVWLSTYNATRQLLDPHKSNDDPSWFGHKHTAIQLMGLHVLSSLAVVAATQPLDVIKTHLQLKNGKSIYKDSLSTAFKLFMEQGPKSLFKGSVPRGLKILINGGLTAAVYGSVENLVGVAGGQTLFGE